MQEQEASKRPLGEILVERGVISRVDLATLLAEQERNLQKRHSTTLVRKQDSLFGKLVVVLGFATAEQANAAIREQARLESLGMRVRLGRVFVQRGVLSLEQVVRVLEHQKKQILYCEQCDSLFNAPRPDGDKLFTCRNCGASLVLPQRVTQVDAEELFQPGDETQLAPGRTPASQGSPSTKPEETTDPVDESATKATLPPPAREPEEHDDWFLARDGRPTGPLEYRVLRQLAEQGILAPKSFMWRPGMDAWRAAGDIPEIASVFTSSASDTAVMKPPTGMIPEGVKPPEVEGFHLHGYQGPGALGHVFRARQIAMDREVAVRSLDPKFCGDPGFVDQLLRDSRAAARVTHPGIVQWIDMRQTGGTWHWISELVEGPRVADLLADGGAMAEVRALDVIRAVSQALDAAHRQGVIHRDLKPANIQITVDAQPKLCDLGLTRRPGHPPDGCPGTPPYSAPEARIGKGDTRSDLYALGKTLFHMVTGLTPPDVPGADPRAYNPLVSAGTASLVARMTAREPLARHATAAEVSREIEAILAAVRPALPPPRPAAAPSPPRPSAHPPPRPGAQPPPGPAPKKPSHIKRRFRPRGD